MTQSRRGIYFFRYSPVRWFAWGALALVSVVLLSSLAYWLMGRYLYHRPEWTFQDCLFMVVITLTTIGYGDWLGLKGLWVAQIYTMVLAVMGVGVPAFVITNLTAVIVDGVFGNVLRRQHMDRDINKLSGHIIVCGLGATGLHCLRELIRSRTPCVGIDRDPQAIKEAAAELATLLYVEGAADVDDVLWQAGVERATGLIACLSDDKENVFVTLSARALNPRLRIISKVQDPVAKAKLRAAGANLVVDPAGIGGLRMVGEMIHPGVVSFLDSMTHDAERTHRFEDLRVMPGATVAERTLDEASLRQYANALVVAIRPHDAHHFHYNPSGDTRLAPGDTVVLLGESSEVAKLRPLFAGQLPAPSVDDGSRC